MLANISQRYRSYKLHENCPFYVGSLFWYAVLSVRSSFAIISLKKRDIFTILHVFVSVLRLFLTVAWVSLQGVIAVFPGHNHLLSCIPLTNGKVIPELLASKIVSEYDQEIPQSQTADNPLAPRGRVTQPS